MMLMASADDLIVVFLALELMSLSLYVLAGIFKTRLASGEASMKYFLLGAFASSFLLYGIALIYGATGTTNLDRIAAARGRPSRARPDVPGRRSGSCWWGSGSRSPRCPFTCGRPTCTRARPPASPPSSPPAPRPPPSPRSSACSVVALRVAQPDWPPLLWVLAALTMTVGNVVALAQSNLKRMLAYSSIAHVGYMLVGLVAGGAPGAGAVLFYLLAYTFTTAGAFGAILLCERGREEAVDVGDYAGLARRHPLLAAALTLFLLSLVGIPPLAGFVAKFYLFGSAVRAGYLWLAVIAVLNSAVAAYYYLRVIVYMYMREPEGEGAVYAPSLRGRSRPRHRRWSACVLLGVVPAPFVDLAQAAVSRCSGDRARRGSPGSRPVPGARRFALPHRGWLFDLDGTVYLGDALIPGADEAIAALRATDRRVAFLSNKPLQSRGASTRTSSRAWAFRPRPTTSSTPRWCSRATCAHLDPGRARLRHRGAAAGGRAARPRLRDARRPPRALGGHRLRPHLRLRQAQHRAPGGDHATARGSSPPIPTARARSRAARSRTARG